jgi:hypothetical protein
MIHSRSNFAYWISAVGLCVLIFITVAPTLTWLEFSSSPESLNIATALEIRRGGNWFMPTLQGELRIVKPPLTAWITALTISNQTMREISSTNQIERENGFRQLAWQTRWPALLSMCLMLLATAEIGRLVGGEKCGLLALLMAGTSFLFLRFSRFNTTDVQLALWVTLANVLLLHALIHQRRWLGFVGGGIALGLAMMSKGPVSLVQTILPIGIWLAFQRPKNITKSWLPILLGIVALLVIGCTWFVIVLRHDPRSLKIWFAEITREGATENKSGPWYSYASMLLYAAPWSAAFIGGIVVALKRRATPMLLPILLLIMPIVVMSFAKDRTERYLLPMIAPAALLAAIGVMPAATIVTFATWIIFALIAIVFPIATMFLHPAWYSPTFVIAVASVSAIFILIGSLKFTKSLVAFGVVMMLVWQAIFIIGYRNTREGRAELKPMAFAILDQYPNAEIFNAHPRGKRPPTELGVYFNRVLTWTDKPGEISPGNMPKVLLMLQEKNDPDPQPPIHWKNFGHWQRGNDQWWAFVLPSQTTSQ